MNIPHIGLRWLLPECGRLFARFLLLCFAALSWGCQSVVNVSEQAQSDWQWKQQNPGWKPVTPRDPRPQWDVLGWPKNSQFP